MYSKWQKPSEKARERNRVEDPDLSPDPYHFAGSGFEASIADLDLDKVPIYYRRKLL
jgi:hypothetical protein